MNRVKSKTDLKFGSLAIIVTALFITFSATTSTDANAQEVQEIKIGAMLQYIEENDDTNNLKAMELSIQDINNDPRVSAEYHVSLVKIDITSHVSSGNYNGIADEMQSAIVNQGITNFIGPTHSVALFPAKLLSDQIPSTVIISPGSSSPVIPLPDGSIVNLSEADGVFRLVPNETHQAKNLVELVTGENKEKIITLVRSDWEGIVNILVPEDFKPKVDRAVPYPTADSFAGDESAAIASHLTIARDINKRLGELISLQGGDTKDVAILFIGYPLDFEYSVKAILSDADNLENLHNVKWYSTSTITGEPASLQDSAVAEFAKSVQFTGTRYTVESNDANVSLCERLKQQGGTCDKYTYATFASYDSVHLLVDSIIASDERKRDSNPNNDLSVRELVLRVAAGEEPHHLEHEGRTIGDGALGEYTLSPEGDLSAPATYTTLQATTDPTNPWIEAQAQTTRTCR